MTCWLRWCVEMETRCRIPIWRTFGRIQWHVIPEPRITLQGATTWWIHCHDCRATCHIAGCSHLTKSMSWSCHITGCNNSIRHIENRFSPIFIFFKCSLGFDERRLSYRLRYTCLAYARSTLQFFSLTSLLTLLQSYFLVRGSRFFAWILLFR